MTAIKMLRQDTAHEEDKLISLFRQTFNTLASQTDLSPNNPLINESLSRYVGAIVEADEAIADKDRVLDDPFVRSKMPEMMNLLSRAEFAMEQYFAKLLAQDGPMPLSGLRRFWYRANYEALVQNEVGGIRSFAKGTDILGDPRPMAFVGSGPLPLSAVDYHLQTGKPCVCIELDAQAVEDSRKLIANLGLSDVIAVVRQDGSKTDYSPYSMIFVAALVENKDQVLDRIRDTASNAMIGVRSADGLKKLLYTPVNITQVEQRGFAHCGTTHGTPEAVNSTCFFRMG